MMAGTVVFARQQQLDLRYNGGVVETSGAPGGVPEVTGGTEVAPFMELFSALMAGLFTEVSSRCSLFVPPPLTPPLRCCPQSPPFSRTAARVLRSFLGTPVLSSMASLPVIALQPRPWKRYLMLGDGKCIPVGFYEDLDLDLHCEQDVRVMLTNVAVVPGLAFDIMSFNRMQERHEIILNRAGASMLGGRVRLKKFRADNFIQATHVPHDDARPQPLAMVAAMMRPGPLSSMNVNDFHNSLGHVNVKALYETAKQMGIKLTGIQEYCDGCAAAKAIKRTVPKVVDSSRKSSRPFQRIFMDLAGGYPKFTGGAKYPM